MDREILKKVYELAEIRHNSYLNEGTNEKFLSLSEGIEEGYNEKEEMELLQYLESLTYEQNLMILTVAYIGRGDCNDEFEKHKDNNKIYKDMLNYVRDTFSNKEFLVSQIDEKLPLDEYIQKGLELLKSEI